MNRPIELLLRRHTGGTGLLWAGPVWTADGYGEVARSFVTGLHRIGFPVRAQHVGPDQRHLLPPGMVAEVAATLDTPLGPRPVGVLHGLPDMFLAWCCDGVGRTAGCTIFETHSIPAPWVLACGAVDEVWVPTRFNVDTFAGAGVRRERLVKLPYGVDAAFYQHDPSGAPAAQHPFRFVYISYFDYRKGFDLLLEAYLQEFSAGDGVELIIKTSPPPGAPVGADQRTLLRHLLGSRGAGVDLASPGLPPVTIITSSLSQEEVRALLASASLYISTDRANGWGMPTHQAMAMGVPTAAIDWSGSTEFMTAENSLLIPPDDDLEPVDPRLVEARPLYQGQQWARVRTEVVRSVMRRAVQEPAELARLADAARAHVHRHFTVEAAAANVREHIEAMTVRAGRGEPLARPRRRWERAPGAAQRVISRARARWSQALVPGPS